MINKDIEKDGLFLFIRPCQVINNILELCVTLGIVSYLYYIAGR